jgi:cytochrome c553
MNPRWLTAAAGTAVCLITISLLAQTQATPPWAYALNPPATPGAAAAPAAATPDTSQKRVPGSTVALTLPQTRDLFNPPDWYPDDHPAMPEVVMHGRRPDVRACGYCHLPNGQGRPENASLAGLPAGYIMQQMADYRNGLRKTSESKMGPPTTMLAIGKAANDAEVKAAAEYFASIKPKPWIKVMEAKMHVSGWMFVETEGAGKGMEPIGSRIIEMPVDLERTELRDSKSSFIAYAPVGSIKKGEALVTTGGAGKTVKCSICHGADLKGIGNVPSISGRSPSYIARQLYDIQQGNRNGPWTQLMKEAVAKLTVDDMVSITAYLASRTP